MRTQYLFGLLANAILAAAIAFFVVAHDVGNKAARPHQSVYERVISSGVLRCGYFPEAPFTIIDPNTGKKSGIAVELAEKIAEDLGVKIEWVSAENFGALTEDLRNGRYDAICASTFNLPRAGRIDYTIPYAYVPVYAYTQAGRKDFDNKLDQIDLQKVTFAGIDGEGATTIARKNMPQARFSVLPESSSISEMLESVVSKKADISFVMPTVFKNFAASNPGQLQKVLSNKPFYVFNVGFGIKPDEPGLKNILDFMIRNYGANGTLDGLFKKYDPDSLLFEPQAPYLLR